MKVASYMLRCLTIALALSAVTSTYDLNASTIRMINKTTFNSDPKLNGTGRAIIVIDHTAVDWAQIGMLIADAVLFVAGLIFTIVTLGAGSPVLTPLIIKNALTSIQTVVTNVAPKAAMFIKNNITAIKTMISTAHTARSVSMEGVAAQIEKTFIQKTGETRRLGGTMGPFWVTIIDGKYVTTFQNAKKGAIYQAVYHGPEKGAKWLTYTPKFNTKRDNFSIKQETMLMPPNEILDVLSRASDEEIDQAAAALTK